MSENEDFERITTTIDKKLKKEAMRRGIRFSDAMELGVRILLNRPYPEREIIEREIHDLEFRISELKKKLSEIEELEKKDREIIIKQNEKLLKESAKIVLENINFLEGQTRRWNRMTGMNLTPSEFYELCKKAARGELPG